MPGAGLGCKEFSALLAIAFFDQFQVRALKTD
jgi:hypothetical protein